MSEEGKQNKLNAHPMGNTEMSPGDQAPVGTPGTGENVCPKCSGKGRYQGQPCDKCDGTGIVNEGIGGA